MKKSRIILGFAAAAIMTCGMGLRSNAIAGSSNNDAEISAVEHHLAEAQTAAAAMKYYDSGPDLMVYDIVPPAEYKGGPAWRKDLDGFFANFPGPSKIEFLVLKVESSGKLGVAYSVQRFTSTGKDGKPFVLVFRATDVLHKRDGKWLIVHEHLSVPVDLTTGKPDLQATIPD
ncbi:MAG TPA: nuclear transport factor 2 family protein [Candidatus Binataceae bacterium]|nr:nuclear transport factor 2 family protein [Candidatus Binataceae bacterium]